MLIIGGIKINKECKLLCINDGKPGAIQEDTLLYVEEYSKAEDVINEYLNDGWIVKSLTPDYSPAQPDDPLSFYKNGVVVYLEREI